MFIGDVGANPSWYFETSQTGPYLRQPGPVARRTE